jgi:NADPH:quinone reductase
MKAIIVREYGAPEVMVLEETETPRPSGSQVLVKMAAAGVNPVDTYLRTGQHAHAPKLPYTPGKDGAGTVEAVGGSVTAFEPGDRVYTAGSITGTYAEYALCEEDDLGRLPDNVSFEEGAGLWTPYATAYRALFQKAGAKKGESVLVHGASGGVGIAAVQWAKNAGLTVIGTASSQEGKELVHAQGADNVLDHTADGYLDEIKKLTGDRGVDVIIEMLANVNLQQDLDIALAMRGRLTVVGNRGALEFNPRAAMSRDATIYGMSLFNSSSDERREIHEAIARGLREGFIRPVIAARHGLKDAPTAHHQVIESKAGGKIVLAI